MAHRLSSMIIVLLAAAAFRFAAIDAAPPGWRDDELIEFDMDRRIVQGWRPLFIPEAEGHEPVYHYLHAGTIALFGENIIGYKWLPFAFGLLSVALTYALARRMFDSRSALLAAALMAVSFWPVMYARLGLRHIGIVPLMLGAFLFLWMGSTAESATPPGAGQASAKEGGKLRVLRALSGKLLAGVLLAAALMTYFAGRALPLILVGFLAYLLAFNRRRLRRVGSGLIGAIAIGALIAAPMFVEIARTPGAERRTEVVGGPLIAASRGDLRPAVETTLGTLGMFTLAGDPESLYNVPSRPVFDWITGIAFYVGVLVCLVRLKRDESGFALVWLVLGIAPAFVSLPAASFSHTIAAQPVVYVLAALGLVSAFDVLRLSVSPLLLVSLSIIGLNAFLTIRDYFGAWANDDFVRFQYHGPTRDIARWLDQNPGITDIAVGTHPNELWLDPVALELDLARTDVRARWFNPEAALVDPVQGFVLFSMMQPVGREVESIVRDLSTGPAQTESGPGGAESFSFYRSANLGLRMRLRANFDGIGMIERQPDFKTARPGSRVVQQTNWQILDSNSAQRLKLFVHVLDPTHGAIAGSDREDFNVAMLYPGDMLFQFSQFALPDDLRPGPYQVEVGWYHPESGERLRLPDGADRVPIGLLEVTAS